jgi:hypothetical protein
MLEQLRQNSRSLVIWVLFIIIIATFILTFGTQSDVNMSSCTGSGSSSHVMDVDDGPVSVHSWRFGMTALRGGTNKVLRSQRVLDALLQRELLAQAAEEAGFHVTTEMATEAIRDGKFLVLGMPVDGKAMYYRNGYFDYDMLLAQVNAMGLPSVDQFIAEQRRELQAEVMRDLLLRGSVASPEEARARYIYENTKATVDVVQFRPVEYQRKLGLTTEQIDAYRQGHETEVRAKYDADAALYKGRGKELKIRQIHIARKQPAVLKGGEETPTEAGATPAQPAQEDPGLIAARQAHEKLVAGADFARLAREISEDERSKDRGGNLGWRSAENPGLGARELADAVKTLQVGGISDVITTTRGYYILKIEEAREGDLSYEQVARDIAEQMAIEHYAKAAARRDAEAALERAKAALAEGKKLDDLFERQQPQQQPGGLDGLEGLPPEILEQLQKQGSVTFDGPSKPAEASWQGDQQTGTPGDQPAAAPAAGEPAATGTATDTAAVTATGTTDTATTTAIGAPVEDVPVPADLVKAQVRSVGPFTRDPEGMLLGVGKSEELMNAIFGKLEVNELTERVYEVSDTFVFLQLVSRQEPNLEDFQKDQIERTQLLGMERGYGNLRTWVQARCEAVVAAGQVGLNRNLLNQIATESEGQEFTYQPNCAGL